MTAQYTPGPWFSDGLKIYVPDEDIERGMDYPVAWAQGVSPSEPCAVANARLIARAPELNDILERLMPHLSHEVEQRKCGGNLEDWLELEMLESLAYGLIAQAGGAA
ncbi:MAG: hypothetical protein KKA12_14480 [Alphaproteobacteria bacterium]|nr:hypothetical protein [Alphaproteobacteria bacterium]